MSPSGLGPPNLPVSPPRTPKERQTSFDPILPFSTSALDHQTKIAPLSLADSDVQPSNDARSIKWLEGLRGVAAIWVVVSHLVMSWFPYLFGPVRTAGGTPMLLQLPIIRAVWEGAIGVPMFAFLTGYVCSLKPLTLVRAGRKDKAFSSVALSAFRRFPRLMLPPTIIVCIAWFISLFGAFEACQIADSGYLRSSAPVIGTTAGENLWILFHSLYKLWLTDAAQIFDTHLWAILPLLKVSIQVYVSLLVVGHLRFRARMILYTVMILYWQFNRRPDTETFGMQAYIGMMVCDLTLHQPWQQWLSSQRKLQLWLPPIFMILGLYTAGYPMQSHENAAWSAQMKELGTHIFPSNVNQNKRWQALGLDLMIVALIFSPEIRALLSKKPLQYLGKISFSIYLVHGVLLRTLCVWIICGFASSRPVAKLGPDGKPKDNWLQMGGPMTFMIGIPIWAGVVFVVSVLWTDYVEKWCNTVSKWLEEYVFDKTSSEGLS